MAPLALVTLVSLTQWRTFDPNIGPQVYLGPIKSRDDIQSKVNQGNEVISGHVSSKMWNFSLVFSHIVMSGLIFVMQTSGGILPPPGALQ